MDQTRSDGGQPPAAQGHIGSSLGVGSANPNATQTSGIIYGQPANYNAAITGISGTRISDLHFVPEEPDNFIYPMKDGYVGIINNVNFPSFTDPLRDGTHLDVQALKSFFEGTLRWKVEQWEDLKADEMQKRIQDVASKDFTCYDCFFFCILSHGDDKGIMGTDGERLNLDSILTHFRPDRCPSLGNKPKVFIFQACRGYENDIGHTVAFDTLATEKRNLIHVPLESDFLIAYPCAPGRPAIRDTNCGSWFIQLLVHIFKLYYDREHLLDMFTRVNYLISRTYTSMHLKEASCQDVRLTKRCYFFDYFKNYKCYTEDAQQRHENEEGPIKPVIARSAPKTTYNYTC